MQLNINPHERWCILGKTGSGKTEWVKHVLREVQKSMPVVIFDPKEDWLGAYPEWETKRKAPGTIDRPHLVTRFNPKWRVQVFQPDDDEEELDKMCMDILEHRNCFVYFDETEGIATAHYVPAGVRRLWKTGRSRGIGAWAATQTPRGIPRIFKSQAENFITFRVGAEDIDIAAVIGHTTKEDLRSLGDFEYLFYTPRMNYAEWQAPIPFKEKGKHLRRVS